MSCKTFKKETDITTVSNEKKITYLSKSWNNEIYATFEKYNLFKDKNVIMYNNNLLFTEKTNNEYFYEIYDNRFLLISFKEKNNWSWSGVDTVLKDSFYLIDLENREKRFCSLNKTMFARQKSDLKSVYNYSENMIINDQYSYHYAIENIDFKTNKIFLVQPNFTIKEYELKLKQSE